MEDDRRRKLALALALGAVALTLFVAPLALNVARGGAAGVGRDPRTYGSELRFAVSYDAAAAAGPLDGTLHLIVTSAEDVEPRLQVAAGRQEPYVIHHRVVAWTPARGIEVTDQDAATPIPSLAHIPPGHYVVQGVLEPEDAEAAGAAGGPSAAPWATRAGNLVSRPIELYVDPRSDDILRVYLARRIAGEASR